jgi:hypothetical protein
MRLRRQLAVQENNIRNDPPHCVDLGGQNFSQSIGQSFIKFEIEYKSELDAKFKCQRPFVERSCWPSVLR